MSQPSVFLAMLEEEEAPEMVMLEKRTFVLFAMKLLDGPSMWRSLVHNR